MKSFLSPLKSILLLSFLLAGLMACGVGGDSGGRLLLNLTDAASQDWEAVYVTIDEVAVHAETDMEGSWTTIATPKKTINLLDLRNGVREQLALVDLSEGYYTQLRLMLGTTPYGANFMSQAHPYANYVIDEGVSHELKIPSGYQTGIKIVHGFTINETGTTELILDFSASESVVVAGKSGKYILKPTIKVLAEEDASIISGMVTEEPVETTGETAVEAAEPVASEGTLVSAQIFAAEPVDLKDQVIVRASTESDETGAYKFFIGAGTYHLVATKEGYLPSFMPEVFIAEAGMTYTDEDFTLVLANTGTVKGTVTIAGVTEGEDTFVTLSFRQIVNIGGADVRIEIASLTLSVSTAEGTEYEIKLPVPKDATAGADYFIVASTFDKDTQEFPINVTADVTIEDIDFIF